MEPSLRYLFTTSQKFLFQPRIRLLLPSLLYITTKSATYSTICQAEVVEEVTEEEDCITDRLQNSSEVFKKWGCSENDISKIFTRRPSLRNADIVSLQSKLNILSGLGLNSSDLVKIINCRPRFLSSRINSCFDERLDYLTKLFGSREMLCKAIVRNPSFLTYDLHNMVKPTVALYEQLGVSRENLIPMLLSRPTLIPRTSLNDQKMEYIRRTGVSKDSKMYKYVVSLIAISRLETIIEKVANLEKFGISEDEVWALFGRSPLLLTLSVDKVQRNMTFVVGTMKMPASVILQQPFFLFNNLEAVLKPRFLLAAKIQDMGLSLEIRGHAAMLRALRMSEKRFLKVFVHSHPQDVADELMDVYRNAKCIKRLAVNSKKNIHKGFPF
ncbi:Transcription termination factor like [Melia azedarach]|uniref:Transcription termination factor like n=1 Tax=Melia azedarach TaxID=155640 RepID=A0ACC1X527_MELAZ|nr:Transcription termination factor like [Melia azedarach]